jgi:putative PIN family toxin of toxin-antitoxin system
MIYLQAVAGPKGPAARLLTESLEAGRFTLYVSDEILGEVREVLERPRVRAKNARVTDESTSELFDRLARLAHRVTYIPKRFILARDSDDEPYMDLAVAVNADYVVTRDKDMLDLMHDESFRSQFPHLTIIDPVAFLQTLTPPVE